VKCEYVKKIKDVLDILENFNDPIETYPLTGAIYVGCYEEEIVSLMVYCEQTVHFYCKKSHRKNAREYFTESEKLLPAYNLYIIIPDDRMLMNFAAKVGYSMITKKENKILMRKNQCH
jgi:hypothetical protein